MTSQHLQVGSFGVAKYLKLNLKESQTDVYMNALVVLILNKWMTVIVSFSVKAKENIL